MKPFSLEEYLKNPNRKIITRNGRSAWTLCIGHCTQCFFFFLQMQYMYIMRKKNIHQPNMNSKRKLFVQRKTIQLNWTQYTLLSINK